MKAAKDVALISIFTALLIGGQLALSLISGVEVVTVLLLTFAFIFGIKRSLLVATAFSLLRCFIFGFFPTIIILYLIYYNVFVIVIGAIGNIAKHNLSRVIYFLLIGIAVLLTVSFTALDNVITPLFYGFTKEAALAYAYASLTACVPQVICAAITVALLFPVLYRVCRKFKN